MSTIASAMIQIYENCFPTGNVLKPQFADLCPWMCLICTWPRICCHCWRVSSGKELSNEFVRTLCGYFHYRLVISIHLQILTVISSLQITRNSSHYGILKYVLLFAILIPVLCYFHWHKVVCWLLICKAVYLAGHLELENRRFLAAEESRYPRRSFLVFDHMVTRKRARL
jgi:hypothetical protein